MSSRRAGGAKRTYSISCADEDHEEIRARARRAGRSISDYLVERALAVNLSRPPAPPRASGARLVLDERAQREMHAALGALSGHAKSADWFDELKERVGLVLHATMLDMLWQGRRDEMRSLLAHVLGEPRASELAERTEALAQEQGWVY